MYDERLTLPITRYLSFSRYVNFLEDGLFLSNATSFEDPWEGHVYHNLTAKHENIKNIAAFVHDRKRYIYVSCWHSSKHESYAMWRIYGKNNAVAIHTYPDKLKQLMPKLHRTHQASPIVLMPVEYVDHNNGQILLRDPTTVYAITYQNNINALDWNELMLVALTLKPEAYRYECELRFMALDSNAPKLLEIGGHFDEKSGISVKIDLNEFISEVSLAPWADSDFLKSVIAVSEKYGLPRDKIKKSQLFNGPAKLNG